MDQMIVNVEENEWIISVKKCMENTPTEARKRPSIYKVPAYVKELNKNAYVPSAVSFGPYHHGEPHLQQLEAHKSRALVQFLRRSKKSPEELVDALMLVVEDLKESYDSLDDPWVCNTDKFLKLMIFDGCFMLEILHVGTQKLEDYPVDDPIFSSHGRLHVMPYIRRDMLMLENQLPMLALKKLFAVGNPKKKVEDLNQLIINFWFRGTPYKPKEESLHILDAYRKCLLAKPKPATGRKKTISKPTLTAGTEIIRSAMELYEAGIKFESTKGYFLSEITFENGVLRLPTKVIDDTTESELLNLIALERLHVGEGRQQGTGGEVAAYVFFMDNIIDSEKDVSLLHESGIIQNAMGSNKAVAKLFNSISKDLTLDPDSSLGKVHADINTYCEQKLNAWRANLVHTYFTNPWASLSFAAAIFLFALTILQTIYTIYPFYKE
ncbi:Protein of unknown function DUF247, plant [Dillenia turbinata]|uniref:Uncharacterized protein n=1 Tax=Dillenia turbinata TaxID=194707 RepID=A0AAN8UX23_9MAGN